MGGEYALYILLVIAACVGGALASATLARRAFSLSFPATLAASLSAFLITILIFAVLYLMGRSWGLLHFSLAVFVVQFGALIVAAKPPSPNRVAVACVLALVPTVLVTAAALAL